MPPRSKRPLADRMMQLSIKQVVDAGFDVGSGIVHIAEPEPGKYFPAWVDGHGDHITITVYGGWGNTIQGVALTETPCNYGGTRKWFVCPECARRCGVFYIQEMIACRKCHDLTYSSQYEHAQDRMLRKLKQIRRATGSDDDIWGPFGLPPRGMSVKRWKALVAEFIELREKYWRECENPRKWRNDAPSAKHWKVSPRIPLPPN